VVIPMSIRDFPALVEKAKVVESLKNSSRLAKPQVGGPSKSIPKYEDRKKPYFRPQSYNSGKPKSKNTQIQELTPKFTGPYQILRRIGHVAYEIALPPPVANIHNIFHVFLL